ncbi:hypothetical protein Bca4012_077228 [Brassica carinata]|uniref:Uncharacterized protein n=1 Tax=Brassica carinata TaxID=52824 RepID=A0A8X7Q9Q2_BRACI|nr:hypothetical protein Bca52824_072486 [Brassica carinata]
MMKAKQKLTLLVLGGDGSKTGYNRRAPIYHLLSVLSSSVQDGIDVRSRPPVVVALRRASRQHRLLHVSSNDRTISGLLSAFAVEIKPHRRVYAPLFPAHHRRQRDSTKK